MAEAIVSAVLEQLTSIIKEQIQQEARLVAGVSKEVKKLTNNLQVIQAVLVDAEQRQVKEMAVRLWLDQLKHTSYDMEDVLDEWNTAILKLHIEGFEDTDVPKKVCFPFHSVCFSFKQVGLRRDIAVKIEEINENMTDIVKTTDTFNFNVIKSVEKPELVQSTSLIDESEICGRVEDRGALVSKLLSEGCVDNDLHIISIVGMGGIGKTTLAQVAYNDDEVMKNFNKRIWVCVSDPFDEYRIAKAIIEGLEGNASNLVEFNSLMLKIHESIKGKKFLLVLDDVWTEDYNKWEPFYHCLKHGFHGSKILITTRKETVACMMKSIDIINIKTMSEEESWVLFKRLAFFRRSPNECEPLEDIGRKITSKCKGLPLAAKTMGSFLHFKRTREEWQYILDSEIWKLEEFEKGLLPPFLLSYNDLPSPIRRCFSFCAIFPNDYIIEKDVLIKLWMAQGYLGFGKDKELEIIGHDYFNNLATRSFFQEFVKDLDENIIQCKMHDIVHDFAQFLNRNECFNVEIHGNEESLINYFDQEKVRHLMLTVSKEASLPISICSIKRLRSLVISCGDFSYSLPNDILSKLLFGELTCLRALCFDFPISPMSEIPKEIGKLIHLRYLKLKGCTGLEQLPETLCGLYNLQNLDLSHCINLRELPQEVGKLINLRQLLNERTDSLRYMPIGFERISCLRTLSEFTVSGGGNSKACNLDCLKDLNHLEGKLTVRGLSNLTNGSETKRIEGLTNKKKLFTLMLKFDKTTEWETISKNDEVVLEALQPPPNLETLSIWYFRGITVSPNWMMSLTKLRVLSLWNFKHCKHLPPLGKLPSLESLYLTIMLSLKRLGNEFWGIEAMSHLHQLFSSQN
ncbi:putative disease resistance protein RGA3 [Pistacia vera]|uniref:putative disease resistance protein RGA3 n=1 Tax=Pistacia vera TaxID=55513 RepID=UPI001262D87C|nr:putative disease resistance protein RGA3 [Pistacia vera]